MAESVYKVIELIGTSNDSWEKAAAAAVDRAGKSLRDLRVAETHSICSTLIAFLLLEGGRIARHLRGHDEINSYRERIAMSLAGDL